MTDASGGGCGFDDENGFMRGRNTLSRPAVHNSLTYVEQVKMLRTSRPRPRAHCVFHPSLPFFSKPAILGTGPSWQLGDNENDTVPSCVSTDDLCTDPFSLTTTCLVPGISLMWCAGLTMII